jgi:hypothetical protein
VLLLVLATPLPLLLSLAPLVLFAFVDPPTLHAARAAQAVTPRSRARDVVMATEYRILGGG